MSGSGRKPKSNGPSNIVLGTVKNCASRVCRSGRGNTMAFQSSLEAEKAIGIDPVFLHRNARLRAPSRTEWRQKQVDYVKAQRKVAHEARHVPKEIEGTLVVDGKVKKEATGK